MLHLHALCGLFADMYYVFAVLGVSSLSSLVPHNK